VDEETYLGEAVLLTMKQKDETLVPYAVDLTIEVSEEYDETKLPVHRVQIRDGKFQMYNYRIHRTLYRFTVAKKGGVAAAVVGKDGSAVKGKNGTVEVFLDHEFLDGWKLLEDENNKDAGVPVDITDRFYRFKFTLNKNDDKYVFNVREKTGDVERVNVSEVNSDQVAEWRAKKYLNNEAAEKILGLIEMKKKKSQVSRTIYEKEEELRECDKAQDRLRQNIQVLKEHKQQERYITQLGREEDIHKELNMILKQLREQQKAVEKDIERAAEKILYEADLNEEKDKGKDNKERKTKRKKNAS